jgi:NTE family protein
VIRALEEAGIEPDIVIETSAGPLVGATYASGMTASEIEAMAGPLKVSQLLGVAGS